MYISIQDLEKTNFQNNMFDYVTSLSVIEYGVNHLAYYELRKKLEGVPDEFKCEYIRPCGQVKWRIIFHAQTQQQHLDYTILILLNLHTRLSLRPPVIEQIYYDPFSCVL